MWTNDGEHDWDVNRRWGKIGVMWIHDGEHDWDVNRRWGKIGVMWINDGEHDLRCESTIGEAKPVTT
jgi:predicted alpha/beta-hydrolase family hydrolase